MLCRFQLRTAVQYRTTTCNQYKYLRLLRSRKNETCTRWAVYNQMNQKHEWRHSQNPKVTGSNPVSATIVNKKKPADRLVSSCLRNRCSTFAQQMCGPNNGTGVALLRSKCADRTTEPAAAFCEAKCESRPVGISLTGFKDSYSNEICHIITLYERFPEQGFYSLPSCQSTFALRLLAYSGHSPRLPPFFC